jgi:hypothetical protein
MSAGGLVAEARADSLRRPVLVYSEGTDAKALRDEVIATFPEGASALPEAEGNGVVTRRGLRGKLGGLEGNGKSLRAAVQQLGREAGPVILIVGKKGGGAHLIAVSAAGDIVAEGVLPAKGRPAAVREALAEARELFPAPAPAPEPVAPPAPVPVRADDAGSAPARSDRDPAAGPSYLRLAAGGGVIGRQLTYRDVRSTNLRPYALPAGTVATLSMAILPIRGDAAGGLDVGVTGDLDQSISLSSETSAGTRVPTSYRRWNAGVRAEWRRGPGKTLSTLGLDGTYGETRFAFDSNAVAELPGASYRAAQFAVDLRLWLGAAALTLRAGGGLVPDQGLVGAHFPHATAGVVLAGAHVSVPFGEHLEARVGGDYQRFFLKMNPSPGDTYVAGGALDQYLRGSLDVLFRL